MDPVPRRLIVEFGRETSTPGFESGPRNGMGFKLAILQGEPGTRYLLKAVTVGTRVVPGLDPVTDLRSTTH